MSAVGEDGIVTFCCGRTWTPQSSFLEWNFKMALWREERSVSSHSRIELHAIGGAKRDIDTPAIEG